MILTRKQIHEGEMLPRFYGVAWYDFHLATTTCYHWPFNIILGQLRKYWHKVRYYRVENPFEDQAFQAVTKRIFDLRDQSYLQGLHDGEQVKRHKLLEARIQGAKDVMDKLGDEVGLESMPDDWNPYK